MGSNGTVEERLAEAEAARVVLGAAWRVNLRWPDRAIGGSSEHIRDAAALVRRARPRTVAIPYESDRHPDHVAASRVLTEAVSMPGCAALTPAPRADHAAWKPEWVCYYFINDSAPPSFVVDVSSIMIKRRALQCHVSQFKVSGERRADAADVTALPAARRTRDAQFGALAGVSFAEGVVVRDPLLRPTLFRPVPER